MNDVFDQNKYQVFVVVTPISFPLHMFRHAYFVVNRKGIVDRWDLLHKRSVHEDSAGYVHRNIALPWQGLSYFYFGLYFAFKRAFQPECIGIIEGEEGSLAHNMVERITRDSFGYRHKDHYRLLGPNSNTFVQWHLDQFDGHEIELPRSAIGRFAHRRKDRCN